MQIANTQIVTPPSALATPPAGNVQSGRVRLLAFVADSATEDVLRGGLADMAEGVEIRPGGIRAATRALERQDAPGTLLVDVGTAADPFAALDELAAVCSPDVKVIVIGERSDIEFYREVTRHLGVDEYIAKPVTRDKVTTIVGPYLAGQAPAAAADRRGRVVAVCGVRGGVGATTIAVNLALHVAEVTRGRVALLDLHVRGGHSALLVGARPTAGLRHALENPSVADSLFLDRIAIPVGDRLRVFAAEEPFDADPRPSPEGVAHVLELLRQRFNIIVVDMPMPPSPAEREALAVARQALLVFAPEMASLRDVELARRMVAGLTGAGRTMLVLNRANAKDALRAEIVAEALGGKPDVVIPDIAGKMTAAANRGMPALPDCAPLRRALTPLTQEVSGVRLSRPGLLARIFGR